MPHIDIAPEYDEKFWVTREEVNERVPEEMEEIITLRNWHHPDNIETGLSDMETFRQLAKILFEENYEKLETLVIPEKPFR